MVLSLFGGLLLGSGAQVLFSNRPLYPKPIGAAFVVIGMVMIVVAMVTPSAIY